MADRTVAIGVGCRKGARPEDMASLVDDVLASAGLTRDDAAFLATLAGKDQELAIGELGRKLGIAVTAFPAERLEQETPRLENPSETVFRETGCHGVAEAAALAAAGAGARLIVPKRIFKGCTVAVASIC